MGYGAIVATACDVPPAMPSDTTLQTGSIEVDTFIPDDVRCLRIQAKGSRLLAKDFDVLASTPAQLLMDRLPEGRLEVSAQAFAAVCAQVVADSEPNWLSSIEVITLRKDEAALVNLKLHRANRLDVGVDFEGPPANVPAGGLGTRVALALALAGAAAWRRRRT